MSAQNNPNFFILATMSGFEPMLGDPDDHSTWRSPASVDDRLARQPTASAMAEGITAFLKTQGTTPTPCQFRLVVSLSSAPVLAALPECPPVWQGTGTLVTNCQSLIELTRPQIA